MVHPDNRMLLSAKKEEATKSLKDTEEPKCLLFHERSQSVKAMYCVSPTTGHSRRDTAMET